MRRIFILAIAVMLFMRLILTLTRYIDPDEFAHLHWAYLLSSGHIPYKDFFINFTPLYHTLLLPLFWLPQSPNIIILARLFQFLLSFISLFLLYNLSIQITNNRFIALTAIIISLSFPMLFDKSIELRPDLLMTVFFMAALVAIGEKKIWNSKRALTAGIFIGLSLVTLVKIFYALPAVLVYFAYRVPRQFRVKLFFWMGIGIMIPIACFLLYLGVNGTGWLAYENIIHGSMLIKHGEGSFPPWLPFSPLPLVYMSAGGPSIPWLTNTIIWIVGVAGLFILAKKNSTVALVFFLFLAAGSVSLFIFPTPYLQYVIPLSVFVSILAAIAIQPKGFLVLFLLLSFFQQYQNRINNTNEEQLHVIGDVLTVIRPNEPVYDMVGSYVFRPDGYFICCNIYSQFADKLDLPLPTLARSLVASQTKFLVLDRAGKSLWLPKPDDLLFLKTNYLPSAYPKIYTLGVQFRCQNGACVPPAAARSTNFFTILVPETYTVTIEPNNEVITIDGKEIRNGQTLDLTAGPHQFLVSPPATLLRIQLDR